MNELLNRSLSQIVTDDSKTALVFEKFGLDFCCKGKRSLQRACEEKAIAPENILLELSTIQNGNVLDHNFSGMPLPELTSYIVKVHHRYVKENAPAIEGYLQKVASKHGDRFPFMKDVFVLFKGVSVELDNHMKVEEQVVFPILSISGSDDTNVHEEIYQMVKDHEFVGSSLEKIRALTNNYTAPEQACTTFRLVLNLLQQFEVDLHQHVHLENNILFPKYLEALDKVRTLS